MTFTIQREQNQIIRDTKAGLIVCAGRSLAGKTEVPLRRVAYLLYRYRGNPSSSQVIMFSLNQSSFSLTTSVMFLPELGEQNMVQFTYYLDYVTRRLPHY